MDRLEQLVTENPRYPRLVVMHLRNQDGSSRGLNWGVCGGFPVMAMIGMLTRIQMELQLGLTDRVPEPCSVEALAVLYDPQENKFQWFVHPDIPVDPLVGYIDLIKSTMASSHMAQGVARDQTCLLGPDGMPFGR